jgi:hypothetical protein
VRPGFYISIEQLFKTYPSAAAAITGLSAIDEKSRVLYPNKDIQSNEGIIENWLLKIARNQCIQACAIVVKRTVYEKLGGFFAVHYGEDWEMWTRIAAHYPVAYTPKNLAFYRLHNNNISTRYLSSGQNIKDIETVIEIIQGYLPPDKKRTIKKIAKKNYSIYFTGQAQKIYKVHKKAEVALKQAHGALQMHLNGRTLMSLLKLYAKILIYNITPK